MAEQIAGERGDGDERTSDTGRISGFIDSESLELAVLPLNGTS
jgi:hypothetical protein